MKLPFLKIFQVIKQAWFVACLDNIWCLLGVFHQTLNERIRILWASVLQIEMVLHHKLVILLSGNRHRFSLQSLLFKVRNTQLTCLTKCLTSYSHHFGTVLNDYSFMNMSQHVQLLQMFTFTKW